MAISDIWTLEPDGSPEDAATLTARGFESATLTRASQVPAELSLVMPNGAAMSMGLGVYTWASAWVLRRDGVVVFRGFLSTTPERSGENAGERLTLTFHDLWWKLDRTPFSQVWKHGAGESLADVRTGRARLAWNARTGDRETTADALAEVIAAASAAGLTVTLDASAMTPLVPPPIEAMNQSCGDMLREILRYHPECVARMVPGESGDVLTVTDRGTAGVVSINLSDESLANARLNSRDDMVVDSVHVKYEADMARSAAMPGEEETDGDVIRTRRRLAVFEDIYPPESPLTWRSLLVTLPYKQPEGAGAGDSVPPIPHRQPVKTRPLPAAGAYNLEAEKFYLKLTGLEALGLTVDDIKLPTATVGNVLAHTLAFANPADDPNDPLFEMPSAINPASTPLFRPTAVGDLPRYIVSGTVAEWMNVKVADVRCRATVAVSKAAVDALTPRNFALFMAKRPKPGTVQAVDAYLVEAEFVVRGTTAKTKNYVNWTATNTGAPVTDNAAASAAAESATVIPDLAERLYTPRSVVPYEGSLTLTDEEAGEVDFLGSAIRLVHADRSEWTTMRGLVQRESLDLATGKTAIALGLPKHLSPQDIATLYEAPRQAASGGGVPRPPVAPTTAEEAGEEDEDETGAGVFLPTVGPVTKGESLGIENRGLWSLEITDEALGKFRILNPGTIKKTSAYDASGLVTVANIGNEFTAAAGSALILNVAPDATITAEVVTADWTGWPYPIETEETTPAGNWVMKFFRLVLWDFVASTTDVDAVKMKSGVFAEFRGFRDNLQLFPTEMEDIGGRVVPVLELLPSAGCRRS